MKFRILLKSFNNELIHTSSQILMSTLSKSDCKLSGAISLPIRIKRFCVLRSPHVDKDSREHFELRLYKRFFWYNNKFTKYFRFIIKNRITFRSIVFIKNFRNDNKLDKNY